LRPTGPRVWSVVLLTLLLALAVVLSSLGARLGSSPFVASSPPSVTNKTEQTKPFSGTLVVRASRVRNSTILSFISNANVTVSNANNPARSRLALRTNQTGEVQLTLSPAAYIIEVSNVQFQASTQAQVYPNSTTVVEAYVSRQTYSVSFAELSDTGSSGYQSPWAPVALTLNSSSATFGPNSRVFIDGNYSLGPFAVISYDQYEIFRSQETQVETPATVIASDLRVSPQGDVLWLTLQPEQFMPVSNLRSVTLATYSANLSVTVHGN